MSRSGFLRTLALLPFLLSAADQPGKVILIVGSPGSGKTTQAKRLSKKYDIPVISMSEALKHTGGWSKAGSTKGTKLMKAQVESGDLLSDDVANEVIKERLERKDAAHGFILDGYPATSGQAEFLESWLKEHRYSDPVVIHLEVTDAIARDRMKSRGRADDKAGLIDTRLTEYHRDSAAVLSRYTGDRLITIDAAQPESEVWSHIEASLGSH